MHGVPWPPYRYHEPPTLVGLRVLNVSASGSLPLQLQGGLQQMVGGEVTHQSDFSEFNLVLQQEGRSFWAQYT
jgi:hypothetical protein